MRELALETFRKKEYRDGINAKKGKPPVTPSRHYSKARQRVNAELEQASKTRQNKKERRRGPKKTKRLQQQVELYQK